MLAAVKSGEGATRKTCFVAMPVTTPASYAEDLRDPDHFAHVLKHLFIPALEQAGYEVIPPKMLGAALIHAEIIRHLEQADLVLADLSSRNANVYFELGVRTSLDRPVVLVKDTCTETLPFDVGPINVLTYNESLAPWLIEDEIKGMAEHVSKVPVGSSSGNEMWKYFGLTKRGGPAETGSVEAKIDLLVEEVTRLRLSPASRTVEVPVSMSANESWAAMELVAELNRRVKLENLQVAGILRGHGTRNYVLVVRGGSPSPALKQYVKEMPSGPYSDIIGFTPEIAKDMNFYTMRGEKADQKET